MQAPDGGGGRTGPAGAPDRICPDCRRSVGLLIGESGWSERVDPPRFDPNLGWICAPHVCPESLERVRRERLGEPSSGEQFALGAAIMAANGRAPSEPPR